MGNRNCKNCGCSIRHKHSNAKFCGLKCKDRFHNRLNPRGYGARRVDEAFDDDLSWDAHKH